MATNADETAQIDKLRDIESFQIWNLQVTVLFKAGGLFEIVNGEQKLDDLKSNEDKQQWIKKDARAQKILITTIHRNVLMHIINSENAAKMYKKLCEIYQKEGEQQKCVLLQEFFNFHYEKGNDLSMHISKLENLVYRLKSLKQIINEEMLISKILSTLPENYRHFRTAWESTPTQDRTLTNLTSRLIAEESMYKNNEGERLVAFNTMSKVCYKCKKRGHIERNCKLRGNTEIKCYRCDEKGHIARNCEKGNEQKGTITCEICKKNNHETKDCYFRKDRAGNSLKQTKKVAFLTEKNLREQNNMFVLDSGSTSHMVNNIGLFNTIEKTNTEILVAKKNISMKVEGKGNIETNNYVLKDVLYVPELSKNLLSVSTITENGGQVKFKDNKVYITKEKQLMIEGEKSENGLYMINLDKNKNVESLLTVSKEEKVKAWHRKLGHLSIKNMKKLIDNELAEGIEISKKDCDLLEELCEVCLKAKQTRFPFKSQRSKAQRPLEIVHTDVAGPIEPITWDGKKYFLTFIDDYTNYTVVYLINNKSEVHEYLKEYVEEMESYTNLRVSKLRSDNGGEYVNNEVKIWCKKKGIVLDVTVPYTPQLNGKAERLNRTLMDKARSLIFDSGISKKFWGEAVRVSAYILNRSPTDNLSKTPSELWTNKKPDLSRLQIFGTEAYAKVIGYLKKLDERSKKYLFVGYALNGYRLWDEQKQKIVVYRDVIFSKPKDKNAEKPQEQELQETESEEDKTNEVKNEEETQRENVTVDVDSEQAISETEEINELKFGEEKQDRKGRNIILPKRYEDFVLLTYQEAINGPENTEWKKAIEEEKKSLEKNETWKYIDIKKTNGNKILTNKWVFKTKDNGNHKARLVVRGCQQEQDFDYKETFSPVVNVSSLRLLLCLAVQNDYFIKKFDIKTAFLYGKLDDDIYMTIPEGYEKQNNTVCHLKKALYGLKQAPLKWNEHFTNILKEKGMYSLNIEKCIFRNEKGTVFLAIYVDDGLIIGKDESEINNLLKILEEKFEIKKFDKVNSFLGINVIRGSDFIKLEQKSYVETILEKFGMENAKPAVTPMVASEIDRDEKKTKEHFPYREAIGSLLYISNKTRPDIAYSVGIGTRNLENPTRMDINNAKRIMRYLKSTKDDGIIYKKCLKENDLQITGFCDSDYAGDIQTRKSTTGYVIYLNEGPISWCSRKQPIVALSSTEAEYIAAADCVKELLFLKSLLKELVETKIMVKLKIDNQSTIKLIKNGQFNRRSKHIDVRYHFINEKVKEEQINIDYLCSEEMIADILTKNLNAVKFKKHKNSLVK